MLMLTELPEMVTVFESNFSSFNTVKVILVTCMMMSELIEGYHYCMPLETLLALNYNSVILTVKIIGVYSHARDMYC